MSSTYATLLSLPPELILEISDHLPPDAHIALKLTHSILNNTLPAGPRFKNTTISPCAGFAINTYLSRPDPNPSHLRCILCKCLYPISLFHSSSSPACLPVLRRTGETPTEVIELPQRFCAWHVGRLTRIVRVPHGEVNEWVGTKERICLHCGVIRGWRDCLCDCQSCGTREVWAYTRFMDEETECSRFQFWRKEGRGRLFVRETRWAGGEDVFPRWWTVDMEVRFEEEMADPSVPGPPQIHEREPY